MDRNAGNRRCRFDSLNNPLVVHDSGTGKIMLMYQHYPYTQPEEVENPGAWKSQLMGTEEDIREDIKKRIETGMRNRGFILSTACSIAPKVPEKRVQILSELVERYGRYA